MASASSLSSKSDLDHWRISATVYKDRVEEQRYITDTARGIRRRQYTKVWYDDELLGRGGFGEVRLQKSETSSGSGSGRGDAETRAVKRIPLAGKGWSDRECEKELKALLEFSKPKVRHGFLSSFSTHSSADFTFSSHSSRRLLSSSSSLAGSKTDPISSLPWSICPLETWRRA